MDLILAKWEWLPTQMTHRHPREAIKTAAVDLAVSYTNKSCGASQEVPHPFPLFYLDGEKTI